MSSTAITGLHLLHGGYAIHHLHPGHARSHTDPHPPALGEGQPVETPQLVERMKGGDSKAFDEIYADALCVLLQKALLLQTQLFRSGSNEQPCENSQLVHFALTRNHIDRRFCTIGKQKILVRITDMHEDFSPCYCHKITRPK